MKNVWNINFSFTNTNGTHTGPQRDPGRVCVLLYFCHEVVIFQQVMYYLPKSIALSTSCPVFFFTQHFINVSQYEHKRYCLETVHRGSCCLFCWQHSFKNIILFCRFSSQFLVSRLFLSISLHSWTECGAIAPSENQPHTGQGGASQSLPEESPTKPHVGCLQ